MRLISSVLLAVLGVAAWPAPAATSADPRASPVTLAPSINAEDFARFEQTLASDEFGGRKPGTPGAQKTLDFLVAEFQRMGLQPGNSGSWFQTVPVDSTLLVNTDVKLDIASGAKRASFANQTDMVVRTLQSKVRVDLKDSPIVFLGYGIDAPNWHWLE